VSAEPLPPIRLGAARRRPSGPAAPKHLVHEARRFWRGVVAEYVLEAHHLALLERGPHLC